MNPRAFGLATGIVYALLMAILAWVAAFFHVGQGAVTETARFYPGYRATPAGGVMGGIYGLATGFATGWITAWLYNRFLTNRR